MLTPVPVGWHACVCVQERLAEGLTVTTEFHSTVQELLQWVAQTDESLSAPPAPSFVLETVMQQIQEHKVSAACPAPALPGAGARAVPVRASPGWLRARVSWPTTCPRGWGSGLVGSPGSSGLAPRGAYALQVAMPMSVWHGQGAGLMSPAAPVGV